MDEVPRPLYGLRSLELVNGLPSPDTYMVWPPIQGNPAYAAASILIWVQSIKNWSYAPDVILCELPRFPSFRNDSVSRLAANGRVEEQMQLTFRCRARVKRRTDPKLHPCKIRRVQLKPAMLTVPVRCSLNEHKRRICFKALKSETRFETSDYW